MKKRHILILLFLFSFIICTANKAEATDDNFTFTQIDLIYSDTSLNTSMTGLNISAVFNPTNGYVGTAVFSDTYTVPDGTITGMKIYANYTLGGGRGSGTADWTPSTVFPIEMSGWKPISIFFDYNPATDWYPGSSVISD